jgi:hypothetical protein
MPNWIGFDSLRVAITNLMHVGVDGIFDDKFHSISAVPLSLFLYGREPFREMLSACALASSPHHTLCDWGFAKGKSWEMVK